VKPGKLLYQLSDGRTIPAAELVDQYEKAAREVRALRAGIAAMRKAISGQGSITESDVFDWLFDIEGGESKAGGQ
jgi:hypothetical protein